MTSATTDLPSGTTTVDLGPVDQVPVGEGRAFAVDGRQIAVFRLRDGRIRALSAVCPHKGGPIADGQIDAGVVLCPLHLRAFDLDTGCAKAGGEALPRYEIHLDAADHLHLTLG